MLILYIIAYFATCLSLANSQACVNKYGSQNTGQCQGVDECRGAALIGNCPSSQICCIQDTNPQPAVPANMKLTKNMFLKLVGSTTRNDYMYNYVAASMQTAGVLANDHQIAAYLSQLVGESNYFRNLESNVLDDPDVDEILGNNQAGDGTRFLGRGGILVRGRDNYRLANICATLSK